MSKTFLTIAARIPLPDDRIEAHKIEGKFLVIAEDFRSKFLKAATDLKIEGGEFETRTMKTKEPKPKAAQQPAPAAAQQQNGAAPNAEDPSAGKPAEAGAAPPWAQGGSITE